MLAFFQGAARLWWRGASRRPSPIDLKPVQQAGRLDQDPVAVAFGRAWLSAMIGWNRQHGRLALHPATSASLVRPLHHRAGRS